jgi:ketosteroid isomerase-like protein
MSIWHATLLFLQSWLIMSNVHSSEEIRKVARAFDQALESKNEQAVMDMFADDCEIELLGVKLLGKEGARKWFNWLYKHVAKLKLLPVTIMVEGNTFFEEFTVEATFHDGEEARSNQAEVLVFKNLKIKSLRLYFDRLDFSSSVAKDVISKTIVRQLIKKSLEGLT